MRVGMIFGLTVLLGLCVLAGGSPAMCGNLLFNPGFETWTGYGNVYGANMTAPGTYQGWSYIFPAVTTYAYNENVMSTLPQVYDGTGSLRMCTNGFPFNGGYGIARIWQEPQVSAGTSYTASAYLKTVDNSWDDTGFGDYTDDSAYMQVEELDDAGAATATVQKVEIKTANEAYTKLQIGPWTAAAATKKIRYTLGFKGGAEYRLGWASWDNAVLDGAGPPPPTVTLSGTITSGGAALSGVAVTVAGVGSTTTGVDGNYSLSTPYTGVDYQIRFAKSGYYAQSYIRAMQNPSTVVNASLVPANLLSNAGADDGLVPGADYVWNAWTRAYDPTDTATQWGTERDFKVYHASVITHDGDDALTCIVYPNNSLGARVYQEVAVQGDKTYIAKTWFRPGLQPGCIAPEWTMWGDSLTDDQQAAPFC